MSMGAAHCFNCIEFINAEDSFTYVYASADKWQ